MADLFVSYKSEDRPRVAPLVAALEADGVGVWWDAHIGGGAEWRDTIESELNAARCVLVVWSERSSGREGSFVRDEATRSLRRGAYLPVRIDPVEPPLGFGETQALSLIGWKGDRSDPHYAAVLAAVQAVVAGKPRPIPPADKPKPGVDRRLVLAGGGTAAAAAVVGGGAWWALHRAPAAAGDSVAVLPFENLSGDPAQAYFSDGIAEELRGALTRIARLKVAARTSSELMRDADVPAAAVKLGVANIVTGSVNRGGGTIRINAQLVEGKTGLVRWSQAYDRAIGDALAIETGIAESVASALQIALGRAEKALLSLGGTTNPVARDAYLRGSALSAQQKSEAAIKEFDAAIAADSDYAIAHAARAQSVVTAAVSTLAGAQLRTKLTEAEAEARRAVALAPGLGYPLAMLGDVLENRLSLVAAAAAYVAAYKASPGDASVLRRRADFLSKLGDGDALALYQRARELDPLRPSTLSQLGAILLNLGRTDEAISTLRTGLTHLPGSSAAKSYLAIALIVGKSPGEALKVAALLPSDDSIRLMVEAVANGATDRAASNKALAALERMDGVQYQVAEVHAQRGEPDLAFTAIARAWDTADPGLTSFKTDPLLAPLRPDPRFGEWLRKIGFP